MPTDFAPDDDAADMPVVLLLGDVDWTDLTAMLSLHARVRADSMHAEHDADLAVVAVGAAAQEAYALAVAGHAQALVLVACEPPSAEVAESLRELEIPVLLIWGEDDDV